MPKRKDKTEAKAEIILPSKEEVTALAKSTQPTWISVAYNIATVIRQVGNTLGGVRPEVDHVFGRCMGERSDGKTFFSSVIVPWVQDEGYDWKPTARRRLDSYLLPECSCDARFDETKICEFHLNLIEKWEAADWSEVRLSDTKMLPGARKGRGIFPDTNEMNKLYPWIRETKDGTRYMCCICGFGKEPGTYAMANQVYRNIFVRDHSHCGFGNPEKYSPARWDPDYRADVERSKQLTEEAINPKSPAPGHAPRCVCHRCRMAAEHRVSIMNEAIEALKDIGDLDRSYKAYREFMKMYPPNLTDTNFLFSGKAPIGPDRVQDLDSSKEMKCKNCKQRVYEANGFLWHMDRFRACHWNGMTVAEVA